MKNRTKKKKCYIYTRVSTSIQVEGYSLDAQRDRLIKEAKHRDMKVVREFSDEGKSGKNIKERPQFQEMMKAIQHKEDDVDYVLVFKLSRFGRNTADILTSLQIMQDFGVNLLCVDDSIDSAGASGKLMIPVLSAVAEIERENIQAQTMAGRWQKAREGKWNGGFAPYGYKLVDGKLVIEKEEAKIIKLIYKEYVGTSKGIGGVAKWLNDRGYKKVIRQNGTIDRFSTHFVKGVLDNPVYSGFIAYGRRKNEKIEGKHNEYHIVKQSEYEVYEGVHKAIIPRDLWISAYDKRQQTSVRYEKIHSLEHEHILSGVLKCPVCGASMYGNVNRKKKKDGTYYKDGFYYVCKHRKLIDGHECTYRKQPPQDKVNAEVEAIFVEAISSPIFAESVINQFGQRTNVAEINRYIKALKKERANLENVKSRLFEMVGKLNENDDLYEVKYSDIQTRLDKIYIEIKELEKNIMDEEAHRDVIFEGKLSMDGAYEFLKAAQELFPTANDKLKKGMINELIDRVDLFKERQADGRYVKSVRFKFPILYKGEETQEVWWDNVNHVETVCLLSNRKPDSYVHLNLKMEDYYRIKDAEKEQGKK